MDKPITEGLQERKDELKLLVLIGLIEAGFAI